MPGTCPICQRPSTPGSMLCEIHATAETNVMNAYREWLRAFDGQLSLDDYLRAVLRLDETGSAAKEVVGYLLSKGGQNSRRRS